MPRNKSGNKSARGGNSQNTPRGGGGGRGRGGRGGSKQDTSFVPFKGTAASRGNGGFTLQEEARNTERHNSSWNSDQRLRDTRVTFVSAGTLGSTRPDDGDPDLGKMCLDDIDSDDQHELGVDELVDDDPTASDGDAYMSELLKENRHVESFFIDIAATDTVQTGIPLPQIRSVSPTPSNSSEEVILFGGRDEQGRGIFRDPRDPRASAKSIASGTRGELDGRMQEAPEAATESIHSQVIVVEEDDEENDGISKREKPRSQANFFDQKIRIVEDKIHYQEDLLQDVLAHHETHTSGTPPLAESSTRTRKIFTSRQRRKKPGRAMGNEVSRHREAALEADYIANMDPEDLEALRTFGTRELGGNDEDMWLEIETSSSSAEPTLGKTKQGTWNRSDLEDFDDLSTSDGVMGEVQDILSKRDRHKGIQYLVVWEDQATDEARWVPATTLTSVQATLLIERFEAEEKLVVEFHGSDDGDTSDSNESDDENGIDEDDEADERDLIERAAARMSDEKLARLLAKQEQLGMGSNELILFDDGDLDDEDLMFTKTSTKPFIFPSRRSRGKKHGRAQREFPSATLMADAYDGFDVMDFGRPSLKPKSKGRKGKLLLDLSDSEMEDSLQAAWETDRMKKARKKQEREEQRAQGLLGSKSGKPDLKQKYKEGMGIFEVANEIKAFLGNSHATLALPPMDKADRKTVHELCQRLNLKSLSKGSGNKRFPVLNKTSRTVKVPDSIFDTHVARLTRRFLPRMDVSGKYASRGPKGSGGGGRGGGFNNAAVSYRDGDIVGGSAPELGAENKGRAMLEKMGWSSGTALGALNNKGIMQPVTHIMKTGKNGLG